MQRHQPYYQSLSRPTTTQTIDTLDSSLVSEYDSDVMHARAGNLRTRGGDSRGGGADFSDDDGNNIEDDRFSSRPSSRGDQDSIASTSRPGSRQSNRSRPGSRQRPRSGERPYSAVSFADSVDFHEQERRERDRRRQMMDTPNTFDGMMFDEEEGGYEDRGHLADGESDYQLRRDGHDDIMSSRGTSRGGLYSRGGLSSSTGDTRPPSGRSNLQTPGTPGARDGRGEITALYADDESFVGEKSEGEHRLDGAARGVAGESKRADAHDAARSHTLSGEHHDHKDHQASFVDMSGNFVTDDFIEALLGFKAGDPSLKVRDPEEEYEEDERKAWEASGSPPSGSVCSADGASNRDPALSPSSRPNSPQPVLDPNTVRKRVDKLREAVNAKRAADEAAKAALANGQGPAGVTLLRSNAELDGNLEGHFPSHDFLLAKAGVVRRAVLAVAGELGFRSGNMLLVRCACPEDNVHTFRASDFLSFAGPQGYPLGGLGGLPSAGVRGLTNAARLLGNVHDDDGRLILEYGPVVGMNEFGELGSILRVDKRGSLFQRSKCPVPVAEAYAEMLRQGDDEADELTSASEVRTRAYQEGGKMLDELEAEGGIADKDWFPHAGDIVRALMESRSKCIVDTWVRNSKTESLSIATYNAIRGRVQKVIAEFHRKDDVRRDGSAMNKWDKQARDRLAVPIVAVGVIRIKTAPDFDDRIIPMHCELYRSGRTPRHVMRDLEACVDKFWDQDSTDDDEADEF